MATFPVGFRFFARKEELDAGEEEFEDDSEYSYYTDEDDETFPFAEEEEWEQ